MSITNLKFRNYVSYCSPLWIVFKEREEKLNHEYGNTHVPFLVSCLYCDVKKCLNYISDYFG